MSTDLVLNTFLILWIVGWSSMLISIWVWSEIKDMKSDKLKITQLSTTNKELESRIEGMERVMMKNGYRPPHKR
jgi:hypothetical protein